MQELLDRVDLGLLWLDAQGRLQMCNQWVRQAAGWTEAPLGRTMTEAFGSGIEPRLLRAVDDALRLGRASRLSHAFHPTPLPLISRRGDGGQRLHQAVDVMPCQWGGTSGCLIQVRDLTETTRREHLLKQQARQLTLDLGELRLVQDEVTRTATRLRELTRLAPVALFETDLNGHLLYANDRFTALLGLRHQAILGRHWTAMLPPEAADALLDPWRELLEGGLEKVVRDVQVCAPNAPDRWLQLEAGRLRNLDGEQFGVLASLIDVTDHYRRSQQFEHRAHHDSLTGLPNRERLMQRLESALAAAQALHQRVPLVFIDLDGFKRINDEQGHAAGDAVLQAVAQRIRRALRGEDVVARLAGDEFALILADANDHDRVAQIMGKVAAGVNEPVWYSGNLLRVGFSWGCSFFPEDAVSATGLIEHADARMYAHKNARAAQGLRSPRA